MVFYLSIAVLLFFISLLDFNPRSLQCNKSIRLCAKNFYFLIVIIAVILGGIRWRTGTDWDSYSNFFLENNSLKAYKSRLFEPGFTYMNYFVKQFTTSYTCFLFIFHFLVIIPKMYFIKKISYYPLVSILLYWCFYFCDITAVRNALGVSFLLLSIISIKNKNKKHFIILTLLATSIHYSCAFWFISYYIYNLNISLTKWKKLLIFSLLLAVLGQYIYPTIITMIFSRVPGNIAWKIIYYATNYKETATTIVTKLLSLCKRVIFLPFIFIYYKKLCNLSPYNKGIINLYLFGNVFYLCFFSGFTQMNRCVIANLFLEVILLPEFILCIKKKEIKMIFILFIFLYAMFKLITAIRPFAYLLIPYLSIFNYSPVIR